MLLRYLFFYSRKCFERHSLRSIYIYIVNNTFVYLGFTETNLSRIFEKLWKLHELHMYFNWSVVIKILRNKLHDTSIIKIIKKK